MQKIQLLWNCLAVYLSAMMFLTFRVESGVTPVWIHMCIQEGIRGISFYFFIINFKEIIKYLKYQL